MVEGRPNVRAEQFSRQLQLQLCDALDRSHGPGQGVIGREARAALQRWPIPIYWLGLERWGIRWQVGSIPDPSRGLIETTVDAQSTVVEYEPDPVLRDTEQVPLLGEGGVEAFFRREVLPYAPDAWYVPDSVKIGYEISFTRHFYKPQPLRPPGRDTGQYTGAGAGDGRVADRDHGRRGLDDRERKLWSGVLRRPETP